MIFCLLNFVKVTILLVLLCNHHVIDNVYTFHPRFHAVSGKVLYSSAPSSPYDIAVVELQESLTDSIKPQFTTYFHPGNALQTCFIENHI